MCSCIEVYWVWDWHAGFYLYCCFVYCFLLQEAFSFLDSKRFLRVRNNTSPLTSLPTSQHQGDNMGEPSWAPKFLETVRNHCIWVCIRKWVVLSVHLKCFVHNIYSHLSNSRISPYVKCSSICRSMILTISSYCHYSCPLFTTFYYFFFFLFLWWFALELFTH